MAVKMDGLRGRLLVIGAVMVAVFCLMGVKAFLEQIRRGATHERAVLRQSMRRIRIPARRGRIYTSDLRLLAGNVVSYDVNFYFDEMRQPGSPSRTIEHAVGVFRELALALGRDADEVPEESFRRHVYSRTGLPMCVFRNLDGREMAAVYELQRKYSGIEVVPNFQRFYPEFNMAAHLVGYAQRQDPAQAGDRGEFFYYLPDLVGKSGLEKYCDSFDGFRGLRGDPGYELVRVDNYGFVREVVDRAVSTVPGSNVVLTIDSRAQRIAEDLLAGKTGALVLLDADTGEVLAMASQPSYDLNLFSPFITRERYAALAADSENPLYNRAIYGTYMPGSLMKVLSCLAFLENGVDPDEEMECDGFTMLDKVRIRCSSWRSGGHGMVDMYGALERSCNDYIIEHAAAVGLEELVRQFSAAGIGRPTGFELGGSNGVLPSRELLRRREQRSWSKVDTGLVAMGQGLIAISPLQGAVIAAAFANGGDVMRPFIVKKVVDAAGSVLFETRPEVTGRLAASPENINIVREGMFRVVNGEHATARRARNELIELYGKTGTSEVGRKPNLRNNSFFFCFGEYNQRRYAMFIVVEESGGGGRECAPLAAEFFERYLR